MYVKVAATLALLFSPLIANAGIYKDQLTSWPAWLTNLPLVNYRIPVANLPLWAPPGMPSLIGTYSAFIISITFFLALVIVAIGAIMYMLSLGDESKAATAKKIILAALIGLSLVLFASFLVADLATALGGGPGGGGTYNIQNLITRIITFLNELLAYVAVIALIWGGIMYMMSLGDEQKTTNAKKIIYFALIGLLVTNIANVIIGTVADIADIGLPGGTAGAATGALVTKIIIFITRILAFGAFAATAAIVYGGYVYLTAAGSDDKLTQGKRIIIFAVVGLLIILMSAAITNIIV